MIDWRTLNVVYKDGEPVSGEIVFSHVDDKTGEVRHFAVERLCKYLETCAAPPPIITFPIDQQFAKYAYTLRRVEMHRLKRIMADPAQIAAYPIMLAHMPGVARDTQGEHLVIDGIHRYVAAAVLGWSELRGYEMPPELWEQYLIDIPEILDRTREKLAGQAMGVPIDSHIP